MAFKSAEAEAKKKKKEEEELKNKLVYKTADSVVPISTASVPMQTGSSDFQQKAKDMGFDLDQFASKELNLDLSKGSVMQQINDQKLGTGLNWLTSGLTSGVYDKVINELKNNKEFQEKAKEQGIDTSNLKTREEHVNEFARDINRVFESGGEDVKQSLVDIASFIPQAIGNLEGGSQMLDTLTLQARDKEKLKDLKEKTKESNPNISEMELEDYVNKLANRKTTMERVEEFNKQIGLNKATESITARKEELANQVDNPFTKKVMQEYVPGIAQQATILAAGMVNPALGMGIAGAQAGGGYYREGRSRGMTPEEANNYSNAMAGVEAVTEGIGINNMFKAGKSAKALGKSGWKAAYNELTKEVVDTTKKRFFKGIADNAIQEAITEPIQEAVADLTAGKGNWDNMLGRMLDAGWKGAVSGTVTGAPAVGVEYATGRASRGQLTEEQINDMLVKIIDNYSKLPEDQKQVYREKYIKPAIYEKMQQVLQEEELNNIENEQNITQNEQENIEPTQTNENAQIGENTEEQQITQQENENALKENVEPQNQEQTQEKVEKKKNIGKHYGDLGKGEDTYYSSMSSQRGTGHFGTGTYFVSENYEPGSSYKDRPVNEVSFDNYKLYKPTTDRQGYDLHDGLKAINSKRLFNKEIISKIQENYNNYRRDYSEDAMNNLVELLDESGYDVEDIKSDLEKGMAGKAETNLINRTEDIIDDYDKFYRNYNRMIEQIKRNNPEISDEIINKAYEKTNETLENYKKQGNKLPKDSDSLSTIFMKNLGFEGIDVRDLSGLDDTTYGSVIYDLKNQETPTQENLTSENKNENVQENLTSENENENVQENLTEEESRLSEEQKTEIKKLKDELKETRELTKKLIQINPSQAAELQKGLKGASSEISARIREATQGDSLIPVKGGLTQKELTNKINRLKSNYIGKEVTVDGKQGKITKNAFGKVGVQFEDGSEQFFLSKELTPVQDIDKIISEQQKEQDIRDAKAKQQAQEKLTNEIKEKVTKQYGEETANKVLEALNQENLTQNETEELNNKPQNDKIVEENKEAENEFRRLQEESREMPNREAELYHSRQKRIDGGVRERLSNVLKGELQSRDDSIGYGHTSFVNPESNQTREFYTDVDAQSFHDNMEIIQKYLPHGDAVDVHNVQDYETTKNYISEDGLSGFAITEDGDLISVYNLGQKGYLKSIAAEVNRNAKTLDCYNMESQPLADIYEKTLGWKKASEMDFSYDFLAEEKGKEYADYFVKTYGEPPVVFMVKTNQDVQTKHFTGDQYDEALNYRNSFIEAEQPRQVAPNEAPKVVPQQDVAKERNLKQKSDLDKDTIKEVGQGRSMKDVAEQIQRIDPKKRTEKQRVFLDLATKLVDRGLPIELYAKKYHNRQLEALYDSTLYSEAKAQYAMSNKRKDKNGNDVLSTEDIRNKIADPIREAIKKDKSLTRKDKRNLTDTRIEEAENLFSEYMYHLLNTDRMSLVDRGLASENKPVFGEDITAEMSQERITELEKEHPEFKELAEEVYRYEDRDLQEAIDSGMISQAMADRFKEFYPHYVPISRIENQSNAVGVPLDTKRTGVNAPIKAAKGGDGQIQSLFQTMNDRTRQMYKAADRNRLGLELRKTMQDAGELQQTSEGSNVERIFDELAEQNDTGGVQQTETRPTFTVFDNGNRVTYEVSQDIYNALKPKDQQSWMAKADKTKISKALKAISKFRRGLLTEYNLVFALTNPAKDIQDVLFNSQHAMKTYKSFPEAIKQIAKKGFYYQEYMENGGNQNRVYADGEFLNDKQVPGIKKAVMMPFNQIAKLNESIELTPRLAEYIASREQGKSIQESMLDASRVTTNFKAGGDTTKFLNRNGFTFLNASVQGMAQNVRNIREAHQKGIRGYATLLAKTIIAGAPALVLNGLVWKDDDDYEELSDYVKDNYYIVGKVGDTFIRIPKGRAVAVVQDIVENAQNYMTSDKEIDGDKVAKDLFSTFNLAMNNLAPNNPVENNVLSPIANVVTNKTWYGEDLVPKRLQNKPDSEQYTEKTDEFSKWLGQVTGWSPIKINYLLDQYGGTISDIALPPLTPQAEETNVFADKFTTDATMNNGNPGKFYSMQEDLQKASNSANATDTDKLKYKYYNKVNGDLGELYEMKRNIQMSDNTDEYKKEAVKDVQKKINDIAKEAVTTLENYGESKSSSNDDVSTIGSYTYYKNDDGELKSISSKDSIKNKSVGLSDETYAKYKSEVSGVSDTKEKEEILMKGNYTEEEKEKLYGTYVNKSDRVYQAASNLDDFDIDGYLEYKANYNGTTKNDFYNYMDNADMPYIQKLYITGTKYKLTASERNTLAQYIENLDISLDDKIDMFRKLKGATVTSDGQLYY